MDREARSQPTMAQRIWSSSDTISNLPKTRSLSFSNRNRPGSSMRGPLPTIYSRPESRADSRPQSRLEQERAIEGPKSGVRPLSGRVFMRRTSERGWIAKAYPDAGCRVTSQSELEIMDDLSDCDSFFDDDFDMDTQDEKLGVLLSCNTLGVESKGRRPDWIAGEVGIPEFHCPRCRDHWYGITDLPCDEELARMRREGLWPLGKDGSKKLHGYGGGKTLRPMSSHKEYNALSSDSSAVKLPKLRHKKGKEEDEDKLRWGGGGGESDSNKKKRKRISFKLGSESQPGSSSPSGVSLDRDDLHKGGKGQRSKDSNTPGGGRLGGDGTLDGNAVGGAGGGKGAGGNSGSGGQNGGSGGYGEDGDGSGRNKGQGGGRDGLGVLGDLDSTGVGASSLHKGQSSNENGARRRGQNIGEDGTGLSGAHTSSKSRTSDSLHSGKADADGRYGSGDGYSRSDFDSSGKTSKSGEPEANGGMNSGHGAGGIGMGYGKSIDGKNKNTDAYGSGGLDSSSQVSRAGSKGSGSRRGSLASSDHGKNVRKGVGYMRAVSPTSSEWGDPHHGRSFISSTATSRTGSTSNLLRDLDKSKEDEPKSRSLPAIVPQIKRKQPLMDFSDLMGGFQFTRAWTFSYHNKM